MFAPASVSSREVAATIPGRSAQEINRRVIAPGRAAGCGDAVGRSGGDEPGGLSRRDDAGGRSGGGEEAGIVD
jgi:hypothetical protein